MAGRAPVCPRCGRVHGQAPIAVVPDPPRQPVTPITVPEHEHPHDDIAKRLETLEKISGDNARTLTLWLREYREFVEAQRDHKHKGHRHQALIAKMAEMDQWISELENEIDKLKAHQHEPGQTVELGPIEARLKKIEADYYRDGKPVRFVLEYQDQDGNPTMILNPKHPNFGKPNIETFSADDPKLEIRRFTPGGAAK